MASMWARFAIAIAILAVIVALAATLMLVSYPASGSLADAARQAAEQSVRNAGALSGDTRIRSVVSDGPSSLTVRVDCEFTDPPGAPYVASSVGGPLLLALFRDSRVKQATLLVGQTGGDRPPFLTVTYANRLPLRLLLWIGRITLSRASAVAFFQRSASYEWLDPLLWNQATGSEFPGKLMKNEVPLKKLTP
jgi:hypothetical protein